VKKALLLILLLQTYSFSQNLEGMEGLLFIPSAEIHGDAKITVGTNFLDKSVVSFGGYNRSAENYFLTLNFLPFIEASIRITRLNGMSFKNSQAIGDRTPSMKIRIKEESESFPSLAVGLHDIFTVFGGTGAVHNNAFYTVATKNLKLGSIVSNVAITLGYGTDYLDAANHNFVGVFGGFSISVLNSVHFIVEYDSERTNGAIKAKLFDHLNVLIGILEFKNISCGLSYSFFL